ncbi:MAG TPA: DivIVA domain-containing protein [Firmicutes bacterium]|nr:DivIVA domain-containing protein [Bacillota bacterium]
MFTPVDLETMVFRRGFRGYKTKEVQEFMRKLIVDYEKLYKENIDLREELEAKKDLLKNYQAMEETLKNTLYLAQGTADEIKSAGEKQAEIILREAQNRAEQMRLKVREEIQAELQQLANLKQQVDMFRIHFTRFLQTLIEMAEKQLDIDDIWEQMTDLSRCGVSRKQEEKEVKPEKPEKLESVERFDEKLEKLGRFDEKLDKFEKPEKLEKLSGFEKVETRTKPAVTEIDDDDVLAAAKAKAARLFETTEL